MTDADLSRQLALALGYAPESVRVTEGVVDVFRMSRNDLPFPLWYEFDYRSPDVCLSLLKWLMVEHNSVARTLCGRFAVGIAGTDTKPWRDHLADTLELAVARAVIAVGVKHD